VAIGRFDQPIKRSTDQPMLYRERVLNGTATAARTPAELWLRRHEATQGHATSCIHRSLFVTLRVFHHHRNGCFPANRCRIGGFVRLIRPLSVIRLAALLLGLSVCLPVSAEAQTKPTTKNAPAKTTVKKAPAKKPTYSASSAQARKARLARARRPPGPARPPASGPPPPP
jgi:hypothetical protein